VAGSTQRICKPVTNVQLDVASDREKGEFALVIRGSYLMERRHQVGSLHYSKGAISAAYSSSVASSSTWL